MSVQIITDENLNYQALYCSTTMTCFGPVIYGDAEEFLESLSQDARLYEENELNSLYSDFMYKTQPEPETKQ